MATTRRSPSSSSSSATSTPRALRTVPAQRLKKRLRKASQRKLLAIRVWIRAAFGSPFFVSGWGCRAGGRLDRCGRYLADGGSLPRGCDEPGLAARCIALSDCIVVVDKAPVVGAGGEIPPQRSNALTQPSPTSGRGLSGGVSAAWRLPPHRRRAGLRRLSGLWLRCPAGTTLSLSPLRKRVGVRGLRRLDRCGRQADLPPLAQRTRCSSRRRRSEMRYSFSTAVKRNRKLGSIMDCVSDRRLER